MATLADRLMAEVPRAVTASDARYMRRRGMPRLRESIRDAVRVDVDPVAEYWSSLPEFSEMRAWAFGDRDRFPNLAPPFPLFWMEHRRPANVRSFADVTEFNRRIGHKHSEECFTVKEGAARAVSTAKGTDERWEPRGGMPGSCPVEVGFPVMPERTGMLMESYRIDWRRDISRVGAVVRDGAGTEIGLDLTDASPESKAMVDGESESWAKFPGINEFDRPVDWYWLCLASLFIETSEGDHIVQSPMVEFMVAPDGSLLEARWNMNERRGDPVETIRVIFMECWPTFLLAISLMHCKNVTVDPGPARSPKMVKAWTKRHGRPPLRFHTLTIEPMRRVLRESGAESRGTGLRHAMHIARGHFKDYRDGSGLFGKRHGLYWWDAHVRGSRDEGVVTKDYRVAKPEEAPR